LVLTSTATFPSAIYPLSLHDALPICAGTQPPGHPHSVSDHPLPVGYPPIAPDPPPAPSCPPHPQGNLHPRQLHLPVLRRAYPRRSEEHTSELQSLAYLVCRLLLEKKN